MYRKIIIFSCRRNNMHMQAKYLSQKYLQKKLKGKAFKKKYMQSNAYAANLKQNLNKHKKILNVMFLSIYVDIYMMCCCNEHENEVELHFLKRRV